MPLTETSSRFRWFREHGIDTAERLVAWASVPKDELEIKIGEINTVRELILVVTHVRVSVQELVGARCCVEAPHHAHQKNTASFTPYMGYFAGGIRARTTGALSSSVVVGGGEKKKHRSFVHCASAWQRC